jgi:Flp pilus assembly protein TadB
VGKNKKQDEERAVDLESLEPELRNKTLHLGFRKRVSINKVLRVIEHEKFTRKMSLGFMALTALAALAAFVVRAVGPLEKRGEFLAIGLFASLWAVGSWAYAKRAKRLELDGEELLAVVRERLGK